MNTIYNYINEDNNLWKKNINLQPSKNFEDLQRIKIRTKNCSLVNKQFFHISNKICLFNQNRQETRYIDLNYIGVEINSKSFKITLFSNENYFSWYFNDILSFKKWKLLLTKNCIYNNLFNDFFVIKKVWVSMDSKYYLANKKNKKNSRHIIRVFLKKDLLDNNNLNEFMKIITLSRSNNNLFSFNSIYESKSSFYIVYNMDKLESILKVLKFTFNEFISKNSLIENTIYNKFLNKLIKFEVKYNLINRYIYSEYITMTRNHELVKFN